MKKNDLAQRLARQVGVSEGKAADQLDDVIHEIVQSLRKGQPARLPGLGTFTRGSKPPVQFKFVRSTPVRNR